MLFTFDNIYFGIKIIIAIFLAISIYSMIEYLGNKLVDFLNNI